MGHDPNTKVRYESVQEIANRIRTVSQKIVKDLEQMDTALKVVTDTWEGVGSALLVYGYEDAVFTIETIQQT